MNSLNLWLFRACVNADLSGRPDGHAAESARPVELDGICLTPWECVQWCYERGCLTTTGCDPSTDGCFCANCS